MSNNLILSIFPGIGLLDQAFEEAGYCVVRGPDLLWGGDIRYFDPPEGVFFGIIGGPPCQDFSRARRSEQTGQGLAMLEEFRRVVTKAKPRWWLCENVDRVPDMMIDGYSWQRLDVDNAWCLDAQSRRLRHIQFGSLDGRYIEIEARWVDEAMPNAALASDGRSLHDMKLLQGLPDDFDLPPFLKAAKITAIGNGVPLPMGQALAAAVTLAYSDETPVQQTLFGTLDQSNRCACSCGRRVTQGSKFAADWSGETEACRKRYQRRVELKKKMWENSPCTCGDYVPTFWVVGSPCQNCEA